MDGSSDWIRIGAAAQRTGMSVKTIRCYSDEGLIPIAGRTQGYTGFITSRLLKNCG